MALLLILLLLFRTTPSLARASNISVVFEALMRNCEHSAVWFVEELLKTSAAFAEIRIVVLEGGSTDGTADILSALEKKHPHHVSILRSAPAHAGQYGPFHPHRFRTMATLRQEVRKAALQTGADIHAVVDADVRHAFRAEDVVAAAERLLLSGYAGICAAGLTPRTRLYYDTLAYRSPFAPDTLHNAEARHILHFAPLSSMNVAGVRSCFGGAALYITNNRFRRCAYDLSGGDCEHVAFNACLGFGRLRIDEKFIFTYDAYAEHVISASTPPWPFSHGFVTDNGDAWE